MPIIQPDLSEVNKAIEPGSYPCKIVACDAKTSGAGNPMIVPKLEIEVNGKTYYRNAYLVTAGSSAFGFESLLRACHFHDIANALKTSPAPFDTEQLIGQECLVVIDHDTYNGAIVDRVKSFLPK